MNPYAEINPNPTVRQLRQLALTVVVGFGILGAIAFFRGKLTPAVIFATVGVVLGILAVTPKIGRYVHIGWTGLGVTIGLFTSPIVFALIYFVIFMPIGLVRRLRGVDELGLRPKSGGSYWQKVSKSADRDRFFHQY